MLETATRSKIHENSVESQRVRTAHIDYRQRKIHSDTQDKHTHGHGHGHGTTRHSTAQELHVSLCVSVQSRCSLGVVAKVGGTSFAW